MELFHEVSDNIYNIIRYKTINKKNDTFKTTIPIYSNDTVQDVLDKIALSCSDENTIDGNYIFAFFQKNRVTNSQIEELEKEIVPNKKLLQLIKKEFPDIGTMSSNSMKTFVKKNKELLNSEIKVGPKGYLWIKQIKTKYLKQLSTIEIKDLKPPELFNNIECLSHEYEGRIHYQLFEDSKVDKNIINVDNSMKLLDYNSKLFQKFSDVCKSRTLYFITANDYLDFLSKNINLPHNILYKGILRKYFPTLTEEDDIINISKNKTNSLKISNSCKKFQFEINRDKNLLLYNEFHKEIIPETSEKYIPLLLGISNHDENNAINICKLFKDFRLHKKTPFAKLYLESQKNSYVKVLKESIHKKIINESTFKKFIQKIYLPNAFGINKKLDIRNSYSLVIYDEELNYYVFLIIYSSGKINIIYDFNKYLGKSFNNIILNRMNNQCNEIINMINKDNMYSNINKPLKKCNTIDVINCDLVYPIKDYREELLYKIFSKFYTDCMIIENDKKFLILYKKTSHFRNTDFIDAFITKLHSVNPENIIKPLMERFLISEDKAKDSYNYWTRLKEQHQLGNIIEDLTTSIIINNHLDDIFFSIIGSMNSIEFNDIRRFINHIISIYNHKVNNKKDPLKLCGVNTKINLEKKKYYCSKYIIDEPDPSDSSETSETSESSETSETSESSESYKK